MRLVRGLLDRGGDRELGRCLGLWVFALAAVACSAPAPSRVEHVDLVDWIEHAAVEAVGAGGTRPGTPLALESGEAVFLPAGTTTAMALFTPAEAELRLRAVVQRGGARLGVGIETDVDPATSLEIDPSREPRRFDLPASMPIRLVFEVTADEEDPGTAGVVLEKPSVWGTTGGLAAERGPAVSVSPPASSPPVIVYLIDTLRRDRLGCYGYPKPITPEIDAFAAGATLFERAVGQSSWTKASVASVFTGVWPPAHRAYGWTHRLPAELDTLAEILERGGYATAAFSTNPNIIPKMGFDQGFQEFRHVGRISAASLNELVFEWLGRLPEGRPPFLYVQPIDPHSAYNPPVEFLALHAPGIDPDRYRGEGGKAIWKWPPEAQPSLVALYDAEVAATDASFGALLDELERLDLYDQALIVLTSDHGEEFQEHGGWRHGNHLYGETLDVPLIVKFPGQTEGRRLDLPAQHIDILPTALAAAGLTVPAAVEGVDLGEGSLDLAGRRVYSHLDLRRSISHLTVIDGDWKFMQRRRPKGRDTFLFDLREDPLEQRNLAERFPVRTAAMLALLDARLAATSGAIAESVEIDVELEKSLRALGYLD